MGQTYDINLSVDEDEDITLGVDTAIEVYDAPVYDGATSVTPTESEQVLSTDGCIMEDDITVEAIPDEYIVPTGTTNITSNGSYNVAEYASAEVDVQPVLQEKTGIEPTESSQTITAGTGYDGLSSVQIDAIPSDYVGSSIPENDSSDVTVSGATVTAPAGYYAADATKTVATGTEGTPTASKGVVFNHGVSVVPSVTNSEGYIEGGTHTGTAVFVSANELVSGTLSITSNDTGIDVTNYAAVDVAVPSSAPTLQTKTVSYTPTESEITDTIEPSVGYDGLEEVDVTINPISSTYVGSDIPQRDDTDLTASGATVTVPNGYYEDTETKTIASGSASTPATTITANPSISISSGGLITATASASQSVTPTVSAGYVSSGTAGTVTVSGSNTSQLSTQAAATITPTESEQTAVASGKYTTGTVKVGAISSTYVGSGITRRDDTDLTASGATVTVPSGYYEDSETKSVASGTEGTPTATKGTVSSHSIAVTPSVTNTAGYISGGTKAGTAVTVSASELVSGTKSISANGTNIDVTNYAAVDVSVSGGTPVLQTITKSYTPTESQQTETITAGTGYDAIEEVDVTVGAISSTYVGSGITQRTSSDLSASGATVTAPAGYYASSASTSVASGSVTAPASISGSSATVSTGTNSLTLSKTVSVTPNVTTAGYISSGTAGNSSVSLTASVTTQAAQTIHPSTSDQTISSGSYLTGAQTVKAVTTTNLTADNIKNGVTVKIGDSTDDDCVASILGTYSGGGGGGGIGTLLKTTSMGTQSTSSTTATDTGISLSVSGINNYDLLIVEASVDSVINNRHTATVRTIFLTASSTVGTKNGVTLGIAWNSKISSNGTTTTRASGTQTYGVYPGGCTISNGTAEIPMYIRYNSTATGALNGTYTARVYGVNLYDLIGG